MIDQGGRAEFSIQIEPLMEFVEEARDEILVEHWKELALNQDKVPLDPIWDVYKAFEAEGQFICMVMRTPAGEIAGYFWGFIMPALHYRTCLTCNMDIFFIRPKFRGNLMLGRRLFKAVESELRSRGVDRWFVGSKLHKDASRLFESLQFEKVETSYSKWLGA